MGFYRSLTLIQHQGIPKVLIYVCVEIKKTNFGIIYHSLSLIKSLCRTCHLGDLIWSLDLVVRKSLELDLLSMDDSIPIFQMDQ